MHLGPAHGPVAVVAPPLFEEANRTRAFLVAVLRALAARGIGSVLPDLPGQGDSLVPLETVTLADLRAAHAGLVTSLAAEGRRCHGMAVRSGALLEGAAGLNSRWLLSPQDGPSLLRELTRVKRAEVGSENRLGKCWWLAREPTDRGAVMVAGNAVSPDLLTALAEETAPGGPDGARRVIRLASDPAPADLHVDAPPPWRRADAKPDIRFVEQLAYDIVDWIATCESR